MRRRSWTIHILVGAGVLALCVTPTVAAKGGKGGGNGGGGGGGGTPDPAIVAKVHTDLVVMDADGSNQTTLLSGVGLGRPDWSPDGTQIAFASNVAGPGIYVIGLDGTGLRKVTHLDGSSLSRVSWSPVPAADGAVKLAFSDYPPGGVTQQDIFVVNLDGSGRTNLTNSSTLNEGVGGWSPTADRLAVAIEAAGGGPKDVAVFDVELHEGALRAQLARNLTDAGDTPGSALNAEYEVFGPGWAHAGERIAVRAASSFGAAPDVWVIDLTDPANPTRVTTTSDGEERSVTWSGDDSALLTYTWSRSRKDRGLYLVPPDGSSAPTVLMRSGDIWVPDWRP